MKKRHNLVAYLILPLGVTSIRALGEHFIESYILPDHKSVVIVLDYEASTKSVLTNNYGPPIKYNKVGGATPIYYFPGYVDRYYVDGKLYILMDMTPISAFERDRELIIDGKYSKISSRAFDRLVEQSCLPFKVVKEDGKIYSDRRLIACCSDPLTRNRLRSALERELGVEIDENAELMSKMSQDCFADSVVEVIRKYSPDFQDDVQKYSPKSMPIEA